MGTVTLTLTYDPGEHPGPATVRRATEIAAHALCIVDPTGDTETVLGLDDVLHSVRDLQHVTLGSQATVDLLVRSLTALIAEERLHSSDGKPPVELEAAREHLEQAAAQLTTAGLAGELGHVQRALNAFRPTGGGQADA